MDKNQSQLHKFYLQVLNQFIKKLEDKYKFSDGLTNNDINKLHNLMLDKLRDEDFLHRNFQHNLPPLFSQTKVQPEVQVKTEYHEVEQMEDQDEEEDEDLAHFQQVKQEPNDSEENKHVKKEENSEEQEDSQESKSVNYQNHLHKTSGHIIGTYSIKQKKHIPREEKTKIELENVFVKLANQHHEYYFPKFVCEFVKVEEEDVKY